MSEWKSFCLGDLATFKYGKMPNKKKVSDLGKYPAYSGYRYVGYYDEYNIEAGVSAEQNSTTLSIKISTNSTPNRIIRRIEHQHTWRYFFL